MTDLASRIIGLYEKHAETWDRDRQNSFWNDKIWHDRESHNAQRAAEAGGRTVWLCECS